MLDLFKPVIVRIEGPTTVVQRFSAESRPRGEKPQTREERLAINRDRHRARRAAMTPAQRVAYNDRKRKYNDARAKRRLENPEVELERKRIRYANMSQEERIRVREYQRQWYRDKRAAEASK